MVGFDSGTIAERGRTSGGLGFFDFLQNGQKGAERGIFLKNYVAVATTWEKDGPVS